MAGSTHCRTTLSGSRPASIETGRVVDLDLHRLRATPNCAPALGIGPETADLDALAQRIERRPVEQYLGARRELLGRGQRIDQASGKDVDQLDFRIADEEPPRLPDSHGRLHREPDPARRPA